MTALDLLSDFYNGEVDGIRHRQRQSKMVYVDPLIGGQAPSDYGIVQAAFFAAGKH
jgi:hypothetical protein